MKILVRFGIFFGLLALTLIIYTSFSSKRTSLAFSFINDSKFRYSTKKITNERSNLYAYTKIDNSFKNFLRKWQLTGFSVAIAKNGNLLYAKGFGYANKEEQIYTQPYNIYRIASVSKLITATAVMKLVEDDKLSLDTKVFGPSGILNDECFLHYKDSRVEDITVKNLLNHSAGWSTRWGDQMFIKDVIAKSLNKELPVSLQDIVVFALSKKLHFKPGDHSSYSNLGYSILQLVIEHVTNESYEEYVKQNIFKPIGIVNAYIANNFDNQRYEDEVRYYEVPEAEMVKPYDGNDSLVLKSRGGNDIHTLGAAGGWVISSVDLIKFLLAFDTRSNQKGILNQNSILQMVEHEGNFHPFGWRWVMANGKWWRSGSFPGTSALAVIRNDGFSYVFLSNTSPWSGAKFPYEVDRMMSRVISSLDDWPNINLFEYQVNQSTFIPEWNSEVFQPFITGKFTSVSTCLPPAS